MFGKGKEEKMDKAEKAALKEAQRMAQREAKDHAALEKFGLDFDSYESADLHQRNVNSAKEIATSLAGSKLYSFGSLLTGNANETFALELQRAQVEQTFILIRQNEESLRQRGEMIRQNEESLRQQGDIIRQNEESLRQRGEMLRQQGDIIRQQGDIIRLLEKLAGESETGGNGIQRQ